MNTYRGTAAIGPGNALAFGPMITTRMAGPEDARRAEAHYLALLARATSYRIADGRLTLSDGASELLVFESVP